MNLKIKIENIIPCKCKESDDCTVIFSISGRCYTAFGFNFDNKVGEIIHADFHYLEGNTSWKERFNKNKDKRKCLKHKGDYFYNGFG